MSALVPVHCIASILFSLFVTVSAAQAQFPSVNDLSPDELRKAIEDAKLSLAAYHLSKTVDDWRRISDSGSDPNGLQAAAYERILANGKREVVISFAGSRRSSQADWIIDINQGTGWGWPAGWLTNQRFDQALKFAERYVKEKDKDPNTTIWIVGHSLGGALAQYVSMELGLRATVFDSSALYTKKNDINVSLRTAVSRISRLLRI